MLFGDDKDDDLDGFAYNPFQIRIDCEDEVSATRGEHKSLHEKIDQLLLASQLSTSEAYYKAVVESILKRVTKEHSANVSTLSKAVSDSTDANKATIEKVDKLIADTMGFMEDYKTTYNDNTMTANKANQNVGALFQTEKANFVELRKTLQSDHTAFQSSIVAKITKLQEDLATENKIMDALAIKEEKCKVLQNKASIRLKAGR